MKILFDQGTPVPLRRHLAKHTVSTAFEMGWDKLENGDLLNAAEGQFDLMVTTDQNLGYQQNLTQRRLAILVLPTTNWPQIQQYLPKTVSAVDGMQPGEYRELRWED